MAQQINIGMETGTVTERYPKRRRTFASHLDYYVLDYNSDDDMIEVEKDVEIILKMI